MRFLSLLFFLAFVSCQPSEKTKNSTPSGDYTEPKEQVEERQDTQETSIDFPLVENNFSNLSFPFRLDTVSFEEKKELSDEVMLQIDEKIKDKNKRSLLQLAAFNKILRVGKSEEKITESGEFNIGEAVSLKYYDMGYVFLETEQTWLVFVGVEYESYPADPWSRGNEVLLCTFDTNKNFIDVVLMAGNTEAGDPPIYGKNRTQVVSEKGNTFSISTQYISGEYAQEQGQEDFEEIIKQKKLLSIEKNGKIVSKEVSASEQ